MEQPTAPPPVHRFRNNAAAIRTGNVAWEEALGRGLIDLKVELAGDDYVRDRSGHRFVNLCSCSYLGLHNHPAILEGTIDAVRRAGVLDLPISRVRICHTILDDVEADLSDLFRARAITTVTASAASVGVLPLIASGHLGDNGEPRTMVFDRFCHFSMHIMKPICADESQVLTAPHNDLNFVEDACKKYPRVAYVADGVYSMGGCAPVKELLDLQDRYGLFLYFDDSHSLSVRGEHGEGHVRSLIEGDLNPLTIIVASLCKGFGGLGGLILLGPAHLEPMVARFGGPLAWSQGISVPAAGAALASARLHRTPELARLQQALRDNIALFDEHVETEQRGDDFGVRLVPVGEDARAVECSREMLDRGFYTSAVFFPIVERGKAGLRVMVRADNRPEDLLAFCQGVEEVVHAGAGAGAAAAEPAVTGGRG